jgi:hypothetical protein
MAYPDWLFTRGITTIAVEPQTKTAGAFVPATSVSFFTTVDRINWDQEVQSDDVRPITQRNINMQPHSRGNSFTLQEILRELAGPAGASTNSLSEMFNTYQWFKVTFTRPVSKTFTGYYSNGGYGEAFEGFGKTTGVGRFLPVAAEAVVGESWTANANVQIT